MTVLELAKCWAEPPHVLLVEDDEVQTAAMTEALSIYGCAVESTNTVRQALEKILCQFFDLVFVDLTLPDGSGVEIIKAVRDRAPNTPTLVMTGPCDIGAIAEALRCGAVTVLLKPFDFLELKRALGLFKVRAFSRPVPDECLTARA